MSSPQSFPWGRRSERVTGLPVGCGYGDIKSGVMSSHFVDEGYWCLVSVFVCPTSTDSRRQNLVRLTSNPSSSRPPSPPRDGTGPVEKCGERDWVRKERISVVVKGFVTSCLCPLTILYLRSNNPRVVPSSIPISTHRVPRDQDR